MLRILLVLVSITVCCKLSLKVRKYVIVSILVQDIISDLFPL